MSLPTDHKTRKGIPIFSGFLAYFPHAVAAAAELSRVGNDQHNPGQPLHWAKEKSSDETDALLRHATDMAIDPVHRDPDGILAAVKAFWRAGANLERMHDAGINIFAVDPLAVAHPFPWIQDFTRSEAWRDSNGMIVPEWVVEELRVRET